MIPHTRSRRERLADRAERDPVVITLLLVPLLALVHPAAPVALLLVLYHRWRGRSTSARSPTGHGRVRRPA